MESGYQIYQKRESYTAFIARYRDVAFKQLETTVCRYNGTCFAFYHASTENGNVGLLLLTCCQNNTSR